MKAASPEIVIFGATHVGLRLAQRLAEAARQVVVIDPAPQAPETPRNWEYISADYVLPDHLAQTRVVYAVTDEDRLNIRLALAVRTVSETVPIVITLQQSRLGQKLARHLTNFSFINPPEMVARQFVDAIEAPARTTTGALSLPPVAAETEPAVSWKPDPLILRALSFILLMALLATCYFHFAEHLKWIDALYFVVTMMATVGFGDISLRESTTLSKIIGILIMIASVTNTAVIFALITDSLLRKRQALVFGRRRIKLAGHVIVAGLGSVGLRVVEALLERGETVAVIDAQATGRFLPAIFARRVPALIGDARLERTLRDAGLLNAKALISVTNDDLTNLEIGLNAKALTPTTRIVLRIYDQSLVQTLHERLEIHFAFSVSAVAAERLARYAENAPASL